MILLGEIFSKDSSIGGVLAGNFPITPRSSDDHCSVILQGCTLLTGNIKIYFLKSSYIHYKIYSPILNVSFQNRKTIHIYFKKRLCLYRLWVNRREEMLHFSKEKILNISPAQIPFLISIIFQPHHCGVIPSHTRILQRLKCSQCI